MNQKLSRVFVGLLLSLAGIATTVAAPDKDNIDPDELRQDAVTIVAVDSLAYSPEEVEVVPGQKVIVVNEGALQHDLVVDEWDIATPLLNGGESTSFTIPEDAEIGSTVAFYCSVPGHRPAGMQGTFTVVSNQESVTGTPPSDPPVIDQEQEAFIAALDIAFEPEAIEVAPGQQVTVINEGVLQHDLVVDDLGLATSLLNGGEQESFTVPEDAAVGTTVTFYCSVPGHRSAGMEGTMTVIAPPLSPSGSEIDNLQATIAALEQQKEDLSATATAIATEQDAIDERLVSLQIQVDALIEATVAAQQTPTPTREPLTVPDRPGRTPLQEPTPTAMP